MISFIDRATGKAEKEEVYYRKAIEFVYGDTLMSKLFGKALLHLFVKWPFFAWWFGILQNLPSSKKKIKPFIDRFKVDTSEFFEPIERFRSFNAFFTRKLKASTRPIAVGKGIAIMPADGRYLFYPNIEMADGFIVKGQKFDLHGLLKNEKQALRFRRGSMVLARLCPSDYHRFHFPIDCIPSKSRLINGCLYSVNPFSLQKNVKVLTQNRRMVTELQSDTFGQVLFIEVGATCVGSIHQTYNPDTFREKGDEKGYFAFGASALILLFQEGSITFDPDLLQASSNHTEMRCLMGQSLGKLKI